MSALAKRRQYQLLFKRIAWKDEVANNFKQNAAFNSCYYIERAAALNLFVFLKSTRAYSFSTFHYH